MKFEGIVSKMSFHYFAYGSNMLTARLRARCPSANFVGLAEASYHSLLFSKRSIDGSGKATLVKSEEKSAKILGVLFKIDDSELESLDAAEGAPNGYSRHDDFEVKQLGIEELVVATTYMANQLHEGLQPFDWYLALVVAGAIEHNLGNEYLTKLLAVHSIVDPCSKRETRTEALRVLLESGYSDWHTLLAATPPSPTATK
jgi:gamma-glutamylcyclotransferase